MPLEEEQLFQMAQDAADAGTKKWLPHHIEDYFVNERGADPVLARQATVRAYSGMVDTLINRDFPEAKIRAGMSETGMEADFIDEVLSSLEGPRQVIQRPEDVPEMYPVSDDMKRIISDRYSPENVAAMTKQIYSDETTDIQGAISAIFPDMKPEGYEAYDKDISNKVMQVMTEAGFPVEQRGNRIFIDTSEEDDEEKQLEELTPGFIDELAANRANIAGSVIAGTAAGAYAKKKALGTMVFGLTPYGKLAQVMNWATTLAAGAAGGVAGGSPGAALDAARNAAVIKEEMEVSDFMRKIKSAGKMEAIFGVLGSLAIDGGIQVFKGMARAYDLTIAGNKQGAYELLKEIHGLDDAQVKQLIKEFEVTTGEKVKGLTLATKAKQVIPITQPGGEALVAAASGFEPTAGTTLLRQISERSAQLSDEIGKISHNVNAPIVIKNLLDSHDTAVKQFYGLVKDEARIASKASGYQFDYDKLALEPIMESIHSKIMNPTTRKMFKNYMHRVRSLGGVAEIITPEVPPKTVVRKWARGGVQTREIAGTPAVIEEGATLRSFEDLLDLRKTVNDFKYNKRIRSHVDFDAINTVISKIDGEIKRTAPKIMENGDQWLEAWSVANTRYAKMKKLEKNALTRIFRTPGANPQEIVKRMGNKVSAIDGTFMEVIHALPLKQRGLAEGAVLDLMKNKYTVGTPDGFSAVHFPKLAEELKHITFTSPEAQDLKKLVTEMAKVFKNDVNLYRVSGNIEVPGFQSYLTTDPVIRAKFEVMSGVFNAVKSRLPGKKGQTIALVKDVAAFLAEPTKMKNIEQLKLAFPKSTEMEIGIKRLIAQTPKMGEMGIYPNIQVHKVYKPGSKASQIWRYTDEETAKSVARRSGSKVESQQVVPNLIATEEEIMKAAGWEEWPGTGLADLHKNKDLVERLKAQGFIGMALKDVEGPQIRPDTLIFK